MKSTLTILMCIFALANSAYAQPPERGFPGRGRSEGRGGFDPSEFLSRLDANGNGVIDVDEQQGPAQFMISRLQRYDSSIEAGKPIPLSKISESFEKAREERESGGGYDRGDRGRGDDRDRGREDRESADQAVTVELLVPGFGNQDGNSDPVPLLGFGAHADLLTIDVTAADEQEAASRMRNFDKNKDGFLTKDELTPQFAGNPMDFDRNRDGKLTAKELAVRYAVRREGTELAQQTREIEKRTKSAEQNSKAAEISDPFNGRKSYRVQGSRSTPEGLPGFFTDRDANGDGQVTMAEFASEWSDEVVAEFFGSDLDRDGVITTTEALRAVEGAAASPATVTTSKPMSSSVTTTERTDDRKREKGKDSAGDGKIDSKILKVSQRIIQRNDTNQDGVLTPSEWKEMLMSPAKADANRDGKITVEEYSLWMQNGKK